MDLIDRVKAEFEASYEGRHRLLLDLHGVGIALTTDSAEVEAMLRSYYAGYLAAGAGGPAPRYQVHARQGWIRVDEQQMRIYVEKGKKKPKEAFLDDRDGARRLVLKVRSGVLLLIEGNEYRVAGDLVAFINQLNNIINAVFITDRMKAGYTLFHASALALGGKGIILSGRSGAGKSSAAIWLLNHGFSMISNDRLLAFRPSGREGSDGIPMLGVPKKPRINPGTIVGNPRLHGLLPPEELERYRAMPLEELWHVERKFDLDLKTVYGPDAECAGARLHSAYFLDWELGGGECRFRPMPPDAFPDFCRAVFKDGGVFDIRNTETSMKPGHVEEYERVLAGIPVYQVTGGISFETLVEGVRQQVE